MDSNAFQKKFGFDRPPRAYFSGTFKTFKGSVDAALTCHTCGDKVNMHFRGNPDTMTEQGLKDWILKRAEARHQCPAVMEHLKVKAHRFFADLFRGRDKLKEDEYKAIQRGMDLDFKKA